MCTTWLIKDNDCYLLDVFRARLEFPELKKRIISLAEIHAADQVLIEDTGAGTALIQDLQRESYLYIVAIQPDGDKVARALSATPPIEAGKVSIPSEAYWREDFLHEVMLFPKGRYDDQVDSLTQFINWYRQRPAPIDISEAIFIPLKTARGPWGDRDPSVSVVEGFL